MPIILASTVFVNWENIFDQVCFISLISYYSPSVFLYLVLDYLTIFCGIINKSSERRKKGYKNLTIKFWCRINTADSRFLYIDFEDIIFVSKIICYKMILGRNFWKSRFFTPGFTYLEYRALSVYWKVWIKLPLLSDYLGTIFILHQNLVVLFLYPFFQRQLGVLIT